ncbi:MAG TPA: penicillin-binding protein 2 [Acidimicrobiia bacterium]|nr:penicillin-binding protein 2 [Acidimicrobiia bacterium]
MRPEVDTRARLVVIGLVVVALFGGLLTRLWFLQVSGGENLAVAAQSNGDKIVQVAPLRGRILDDKGRVLAETKPVTTLVVDRQKLDFAERARLVPNLARVLGISTEEVDRRLDDKQLPPFEAVTIDKDVSDDVAGYVWEHREDFPETQVTSSFLRVYPQGSLAAHVIGYTGQIDAQEYAARKNQGYSPDDTIGKAGIEQTFESQLRGTSELKRVRVDNRGIKIGETVIRKAQPGHDVQLSIDIDAQRVAEDSLAQGIDGARAKGFEASGGSVVVLDARTGGVLALASAPTFDPNQIVAGGAPASYFDPNGELPLIDRALSPYPPGSTFKLFSAIATLKYGMRAASDTYYDDGCVQFGDGERCNAGKNKYGYVDLPRALTVSSDAFFYNVGKEFWSVYQQEGTGDTAQHPRGYGIQELARAFGFGSPTGIELGGDQSGRIPDLSFNEALNADSNDPTSRTWRQGDEASLAVGQGDVLVTPLQLANGYAAFANGGTLHTPQLVTRILASVAGDPAGTVGKVLQQRVPPAPRPTGLTPEVRDPVIEGLKGAVNSQEGTAFFSFNTYNGIPLAGKTGTAQVPPKEDHSWFVGIMNPDNDPAQPQYAVVAMVEHGGFGADVAAPIVRRVMDYLNGNPDPPPVRTSPAPVKKTD